MMMIGASQMLLDGVVANLLLLPSRWPRVRAIWPNTWCPSRERDADGRSTMDCTGRAW